MNKASVVLKEESRQGGTVSLPKCTTPSRDVPIAVHSTCPKAHTFWKSIYCIIEHIWSLSLYQWNLKLSLLIIKLDALPKHQFSLRLHILMVTECTIAKAWSDSYPLCWNCFQNATYCGPWEAKCQTADHHAKVYNHLDSIDWQILSIRLLGFSTHYEGQVDLLCSRLTMANGPR